MKRFLAILAAGWLAIFAVGALAEFVPVRLLPDPSLLATLAAALVLGPASGLVVAALLGLSADVVSGTLLGQQAMLRVLELAVTRVFAAQLDLRRGLPLAVYVVVLSAVDAALSVLQARFFLGLSFAWSELPGALERAGVNGLAAPWVGAAARRITALLEEREARREMRLETRRPVS